MFPSTTTLPTNLSIPDKVRDGPQEGGLSVSAALPVSAGKNTDPGCVSFEIRDIVFREGGNSQDFQNIRTMQNIPKAL
jgi:hypothetical protein